MGLSVWILLFMCGLVLFTRGQSFYPGPPNAPNRAQFGNMEQRRIYGEATPVEPREVLRVMQSPVVPTRPMAQAATRTPFQGSIKRGGPPYFMIQPMNANNKQRTTRRLVLSLPKDNIQVLNAEAMSQRGSQLLPSLTLALRDIESQDDNKDADYADYTPSIVAQIPSPLSVDDSRFHYGFMPMIQSDSGEEERGSRLKGRWSKGEISYDLDDLVGSSGGHVTVIKAQAGPQTKLVSARKVRGGSVKSMRAIFIEPKEVQAKSYRVVKTDTESVPATKARLIKAEPMRVTAMKATPHPVSFKQATITKSKGEDWAASNVHYVNAEPPQDAAERQQEDDMPPMSELQCGGTNDLGWCDLGANYPSSEVSQIMEVCEELVSRMYVEVPENSGPMEDIASYSLSRNISENGPRAFWPWKESVAHFKRPLCEVERNTIKPSFAQDIRGKWHVIIQTDSFPQRIALEVCRKPGEPCSSGVLCSPALSQCVQKYSHHQLISFDPESAETCPYVRLYKFPTSCVCRTADD